MVNIENRVSAVTTEGTTAINEGAENPFAGKTIVVTGKLIHFTRNSINAKIEELGATAGSTVSKNTDYLVCGEKAGSKLAKGESLGVMVLSERQFIDMVEGA